MFEIEAKAKLSVDRATAGTHIAKSGYIEGRSVLQKDSIHARSVNDIVTPARGTVVARVRDEDGRVTLNVKVHGDNELSVREIETPVDDGQAAAEILEALGFAPQVEVTKSRTTWRSDRYVGCLDQVQGLGLFFELETLADIDAAAVEIQAEMSAEIQRIFGSRQAGVTMGYDRIILGEAR